MTKKVNVNVLETYKVYQWKHFEVDQEKIIDKYDAQIDKALKTASFNKKTLADIKGFQTECKRQHDMGMSVTSISSCNKALDLVAVN